jgi:hypothetical protein
MGAAQGNFAGAEIVEQGAGALYLCKVRVWLLSLGGDCRLAATK